MGLKGHRPQVGNLQDVDMGVKSKGCGLATYKGNRVQHFEPQHCKSIRKQTLQFWMYTFIFGNLHHLLYLGI